MGTFLGFLFHDLFYLKPLLARSYKETNRFYRGGVHLAYGQVDALVFNGAA